MTPRRTLVERNMRRENNYAAKHKGNLPTITQHIRAEYNLLARRVRKLERSLSPGLQRMIDEADFVTGYNSALNDVLDLIQQAKQ